MSGRGIFFRAGKLFYFTPAMSFPWVFFAPFCLIIGERCSLFLDSALAETSPPSTQLLPAETPKAKVAKPVGRKSNSTSSTRISHT
ncbi:hypothetical protein NBRC3279_1327 [Acetobacter pasteurianus NBRC 3279]|uniref:Uncharacterized protein n=1 Tax=Acetobacter pasteurianus subsp. pasteurianus TaxID=481145 RepID=A0AAC9SSY6_ACEPA|nr:hypothetical protein S101468_02770 [Acetobacter pasteurianus subsp. pasteurianus]GCD65836.1 hypothetical protein NBRC3279_1327 [Acetobacter pasteurianus NBRC 3279]GCD72145.1 hypothetical protein NBRC3284_1301 [Acetobacter pasteurianus NBRC 3284]